MIKTIDRALSDATTLGCSGSRSDSNERYSAFSKAPALLDPHHQFALFHIQNPCGGGGGVLPLYRDELGIFYSLRRLDFDHIEEKY